MKNPHFRDLFRRHPDNPIITVRDIPYPANTVFNAGAAMVGGETLLLMRVESRTGISHLTVAHSQDGVSHWRITGRPAMAPSPETHPEEIWGIEDPRITWLEEMKEWVISYTAYSEGGPLVSLATTSDFEYFTRLGPAMPPEDKDAALFPLRFKERWAMIHRPVSGFRGVDAHIWISFSPDLKHWGDHRILIQARKGAWWDARKIGLSPPPLKTEEGWLILYHGVRTTASGAIYRLGLALLDIDDPCCVTARSNEWVFAPQEPYELFGDVDKVVFPCGWVAKGDEVRLYYGGADSCLALATASLSELLAWLKEHNVHEEPIRCA
jgi:predicted GH43/DUF377 family glycosyl hydrolase